VDATCKGWIGFFSHSKIHWRWFSRIYQCFDLVKIYVNKLSKHLASCISHLASNLFKFYSNSIQIFHRIVIFDLKFQNSIQGKILLFTHSEEVWRIFRNHVWFAFWWFCSTKPFIFWLHSLFIHILMELKATMHSDNLANIHQRNIQFFASFLFCFSHNTSYQVRFQRNYIITFII
jgi:hypothetical protein